MIVRQHVLYRRNHEWHPAVIWKTHSSPRSYLIKTPDGSILRRNSVYIKPSKVKQTLVLKDPTRLDIDKSVEQSKVVPVTPPFKFFNGPNTPVDEDVGTSRVSNGYVSAESSGMSNGYDSVTQDAALTVTRSGETASKVKSLIICYKEYFCNLEGRCYGLAILGGWPDCAWPLLFKNKK